MRGRKDILCISSILLGYVILALMGIGCPFKFLTGISCGGCGMTRAWLSVLKMDIAGAFAFHPLFWTVLLLPVMFFLKDRMNKRAYKTIIFILLALFIGVYIFRMFNTEDTVVICDVKNGAVLRLIKFIVRSLGIW